MTSTSPADVVGVVDPGLGALGDNGGPTPTMLPRPGSPAIDFGLNAESTPADQRGVARPVDGDGNGTLRVDAGAVEAPAVGDGASSGPSWPNAAESTGSAGAGAADLHRVAAAGSHDPSEGSLVAAGCLLV